MKNLLLFTFMFVAFLDCKLASIGNCNNPEEPINYIEYFPTHYLDSLSSEEFICINEKIEKIRHPGRLARIRQNQIKELRIKVRHKAQSMYLIKSLDEKFQEILCSKNCC